MDQIIDDMNDVLYLANRYGAVHATLKSAYPYQDTGFFRGIRLNMGDTSVTQPYKQHVWTYSCIKAAATAISQVPFILVREEKESRGRDHISEIIAQIKSCELRDRIKVGREEIKRRGLVPITDGPLYNTIMSVNPMMTRAQLWEATVVLMGLKGSCFWLLHDGKDGPIQNQGEWPAEIWPVSPDGFEAVKQNGMLTGWKRKLSDGKDETFKTWQLIRFYFYNPYDLLSGLSPYEVIKDSASQDMKASRFNEAILDNGGEPGGILMVPGDPSATEREKILAAWNDRHRGPGKEGKTALLTNNAKYDRNPRTHADMQFTEGRKWNRDETFAAFRTPKQISSIYEDINYATAQIQLKLYWENALIPQMIYFEDLIQGRLLNKSKDALGVYCIFDLSTVEALREDLKDKASVAQIFNQIGIPTADIIEKLELPFERREWMSQWWAPMSLVPVGMPGEEPEEPEPEPAGETAQQIRKAVKFIDRQIDKDKYWKLYISKVFDPIEEPFRKKIKMYWLKLRKEQLRLWDDYTRSVRALPSPGELNDVLFNDKEWQEKLKRTCMPFYDATAKASVEQVADELGRPVWSVSDPRVQVILKNKANKVTNITHEFWLTLQDSIKQGLEVNETVTEISDRIKQQFNKAASHSRTLTIARTETAQCASEVRNANLKYEGVKKHEWVTAGDEHVRDDHKELGRLDPVQLDHNYMNDLGKPGTLKFPSDMEGPADQVINCRCVEIPII
jgi:HK97 family phage portal protein